MLDSRRLQPKAEAWLTGSADWFLMGLLEGLLGVRPTFEGLQIDPCVPQHWDKMRVVRTFRRAKYGIRIYNPASISRGVQRIVVDGDLWEGGTLPLFQDRKHHRVEVTMG